MDQQQTPEPQRQGDTVYTTALLDRLANHYLARTALPRTEAPPLTIERFYRINRCILAEGYGP